MIAKSGTFAGQPIILCCDAKCSKAWGINNRPRVYLQDPTLKVHGTGYDERTYPDDETLDPDDYAYLSDTELGEAPVDPGTYEGGHAKPRTTDERLNKWCARECERSRMVDPNEEFELADFNKRQYNRSPHTRDTADAGAGMGTSGAGTVSGSE